MMARYAEETGVPHEVVGSEGKFRIQPIEGQGNGIDSAGTERGTDGRGRSGGPADEVGSDLAAGRAGTGTGVIEGERDGSGLPAEKRGADAGDYRTGADGTADAQPALKADATDSVQALINRLQPQADRLTDLRNEAVRKFNEAKAAKDEPTMLAMKDRIDGFDAQRRQIQHQIFLEGQRQEAARRSAANSETYGKMDVGTKIGMIGHEGSDDTYFQKVGPNRWQRTMGGRIDDVFKTDANMEGKRVIPSKETANVPERPQVPEEAPAARGAEAAQPADAGIRPGADAGTGSAPAKPEGKLAARRALNDRQDAIVKAAADKLAARKAENEPKPEPAVMTEEQYLARNGAGRQEYGEAALHRSSERKSENTHRQQVDAQAAKDSELTARRAALRDEYHAKVASGEIRPPNAKEETIERANADPALESTQAARRIADKRGWEWRKEQAAQQPAAEAPAPDANPARAEPPLSFMKKVKVDHDVYIRDERRWESVKVPADKALASVREDITNLEALLNCMKG
ncbi:MAG TPA: hypothetical protein VN019_06090 [Oxalicibacterium sp.]|nr:hypothetical protein [Oxalicibacterium sp.]